jgi:hypothetical protein
MPRTFQQHPAGRSWRPVKPIQDQSFQFGKSLSGQSRRLLYGKEARTVRFLNWMSREDGPLTFCVCDHACLRYFVSESQSCSGLRSTTRSDPMIARSTTSGDQTRPAP